MSSLRPSVIFLVVANCLPLAAVLFFDWRVVDVMLLYWLENIVVGVVNAMRMLTTAIAGGQEHANPRRREGLFSQLFPIVFFAVHYGMFCFGHLTAIHVLFARDEPIENLLAPLLAATPVEVLSGAFGISLLAIAGSHLYSYIANFIGNGEFRRTTPSKLMSRPYGRIIVLHVTVMAGGALASMLSEPLAILVVLVLLKIGMDWRAHLREREIFSAHPVTTTV